MAAFELLVRASIEKVSIGPLELGDLSLLRKALPVVIAYYFYDLVTKYSQDLVYSNVENTMLEILHKDIVDYDLGGVLEPVGHPIQGMELDWSLTNAFGTILNVGVPIGILVFEVYAYYMQFRSFHASDILVWISLLLTLFFLSFGLAISAEALKSDEYA